jgi:RluA family pseudouridine synthase
MLEILHLDSHIIVLDKPPGLVVLSGGWEPDEPSLLSVIEEKYGKTWVVHRLDKVTSGVMVFARTAEAHRSLNGQFEHHTVSKVYYAIVEGLPPWDEHTARHMLRTDVGHKHRTVVVHKRGKASETYFKVLERGQAQALLEAHPMTGRTHQVRAHSSALGYPLLGDTLYGAPDTDLIVRPALHALSLSFIHPASGRQITFSAPVPNDFETALKRTGL